MACLQAWDMAPQLQPGPQVLQRDQISQGRRRRQSSTPRQLSLEYAALFHPHILAIRRSYRARLKDETAALSKDRREEDCMTNDPTDLTGAFVMPGVEDGSEFASNMAIVMAAQSGNHGANDRGASGG